MNLLNTLTKERLSLVFVLGLAINCSFAYAGVKIDQELSLSASSKYDDNVLRLDLGGLDLSSNISEDYIETIAVSLYTEARFSRNTFNFNLNASENSYKNNSEFNNEAYSYELGWNHKLSKKIKLSFNLAEQQALRDFSETLILEKNVLKRKQTGLKLKYDLTKRTNLGFDVSLLKGKNSLVELKESDRSSESKKVFLNHDFTKRLATSFSFSETSFTFDNLDSDKSSYEQELLSWSFEWVLTKKIILNTGLIKEVIEGDKSIGYVADFSYSPSTDLRLSLEASKSKQISLNQDSIFSNNEFLRLNVERRINQKLSFLGSVERRNQVFDGNLDSLNVNYEESDQIYRFFLKFKFKRYFSLDTGYQMLIRESSRSLRDFESNSIQLNLNFSY